MVPRFPDKSIDDTSCSKIYSPPGWNVIISFRVPSALNSLTTPGISYPNSKFVFN